MAETLAFAAAYAASNVLAATGATVATQAVIASAIATTVAFAAPFAIAAGLSYATSLALRPRIPKPSDGQLESKQNVPTRKIHYGRVRVSIDLAFYEARESVTPAGFYSAWKVGMLSAREIDAFETHYLHDDEVTLDASGFVQEGQYWVEDDPRVRIKPHLGTDTQTVDLTLQNTFPEWTNDHRLRGIAYVMLQYRQADTLARQGDLYPNGVPNYSALIRASKVYDPRKDSTVTGGSGSHRHATKSTWEWSDNATLCILDWLTFADGYGFAISLIDLPSFMAKADIDDEAVTLKAGGTEKRYRVATTVDLVTERRHDVLVRLLEACDGHLHFNSDGKIEIHGGEWVAPTIELTAADIIEANFTSGVPALQKYNELAFQYLSPDHGYTEVEGDPWQSADVVSGIIESRPFDLFHIPSHGQARRLCKKRIARDNPEWLVEIPRTKMAGLQCWGERVVNIVFPDLGIDGPFWVDRCELLEDWSGVSLSLRSADEDSYDWIAATEEGDAPPVPEGTGDGFDLVDTAGDIFAPTGVAVTGSVGEAQVAWTNPATTSYGDPVARVWRSATADFGDAVDVSGALSGTPSEAKTYDDEGLSAGTYHWWVTAEYDIGTIVQSDPVGPVSDTVT